MMSKTNNIFFSEIMKGFVLGSILSSFGKEKLKLMEKEFISIIYIYYLN